MVLVVIILGFVCSVFVNILADNLPRRRPLRMPHCPACGAPRPPGTWLASLAVLRLERRCAYCGTTRTWRDILVEISLVLILLWLYAREPSPGIFLPAAIVAVVFVLIVVIDIEHRLILHVVSVPAGLLILFLNSIDPSRGFVKSLTGGVAGFVFVFCLYLLGGLFARHIARSGKGEDGEVAFGFGDVMLGTMLGLTVGWPGIILALIFAIFAGGIFSMFYMLVMTLRDRYNAFQPIPYGPFLIFGASLVYFFRDSIIRMMPPG